MAELVPQDELRLSLQQMQRILLTEDGRALLEYLDQRFCERREQILEPDLGLQMWRRQSSAIPGDPYTTYRLEGNREVVLFLKDLQQMEW